MLPDHCVLSRTVLLLFNSAPALADVVQSMFTSLTAAETLVNSRGLVNEWLLVLQDNRSRFFLCTALQSTAVPFEKELCIRLGLKKNELKMAAEEALLETLQVPPGSVNPLAACQATAARVILLLDQSLKDGPFFIHPMTNTKTVKVTADQLQQYLERHGKQVHWVDLSVKDLKALSTQQDLKSIADTVAEQKVKGEAKGVAKGTDLKKQDKAAKCASPVDMFRLKVMLFCHVLMPTKERRANKLTQLYMAHLFGRNVMSAF